MPYVNVKALHLLKNNLRALMAARNMKPVDLARRIKRDESTISKWFKTDLDLNIQMEYLDLFTEVFGLEPYEFFLPGRFDVLTERRSNEERRSGDDRRMGWPLMTTTDVPRAKESLSPRLVEWVEIGEKLQGESFDQAVRWCRAQIVRQGLPPDRARPPGQTPTAALPHEISVKRKRKHREK